MITDHTLCDMIDDHHDFLDPYPRHDSTSPTYVCARLKVAPTNRFHKSGADSARAEMLINPAFSSFSGGWATGHSYRFGPNRYGACCNIDRSMTKVDKPSTRSGGGEVGANM